MDRRSVPRPPAGEAPAPRQRIGLCVFEDISALLETVERLVAAAVDPADLAVAAAEGGTGRRVGVWLAEHPSAAVLFVRGASGHWSRAAGPAGASPESGGLFTDFAQWTSPVGQAELAGFLDAGAAILVVRIAAPPGESAISRILLATSALSVQFHDVG